MLTQKMIRVVISIILLLCCASAEICKQLSHFRHLQVATAANGMLHVLIRNPSTNTSSYHQLPLNEQTVDNDKGRLKVTVFWGAEKLVQTVHTADDVPWLRWLSFWEKDNKNVGQLFDHLQLALLNMSKPYVGSLVVLDGRHYCSSSTSFEEGKLLDCKVASNERVVGSVASVDFQETARLPMLIFIIEFNDGKKELQVVLGTGNNLRPTTADQPPQSEGPDEEPEDDNRPSGPKLGWDKPEPDGIAAPKQSRQPLQTGHGDNDDQVRDSIAATFPFSRADLIFGFIFAGTVHLWRTVNGKSLVCLFDDPREKVLKGQGEPLRCRREVAASEYFQCVSAFSLPSLILGQKSVISGALLGVLLAVVAFVAASLIGKKKTKSRRGKDCGAQKSTKPSSKQIKLTQTKLPKSNAFQGDKSKSGRQTVAIKSSSSAPSSAIGSSSSFLSSATVEKSSLKKSYSLHRSSEQLRP